MDYDKLMILLGIWVNELGWYTHIEEKMIDIAKLIDGELDDDGSLLFLELSNCLKCIEMIDAGKISTCKEIHRVLMDKLLGDHLVGIYRKNDVKPNGSQRRYMNPTHIFWKLFKLERKSLGAMNYFRDFLQIHPFVDGNGRTARMLVYMKYGYVLSVYKNRDEYLDLFT